MPVIRTANLSNSALQREIVRVARDAARGLTWPEELPRADAAAFLHEYVRDHTHYLEETTPQRVRYPRALVAEGVGDCKSTAIFIASGLAAAGYPAVLRFIRTKDRPWWGHVYAYLPGHGAVDPLLPLWSETPYIAARDYPVNMRVQTVAGRGTIAAAPPGNGKKILDAAIQTGVSAALPGVTQIAVDLIGKLFGGKTSQWADAGPGVHELFHKEGTGLFKWDGQAFLDWLRANAPGAFASVDTVVAQYPVFHFAKNTMVRPEDPEYQRYQSVIRQAYKTLGIDYDATNAANRVPNAPIQWVQLAGGASVAPGSGAQTRPAWLNEGEEGKDTGKKKNGAAIAIGVSAGLVLLYFIAKGSH